VVRLKFSDGRLSSSDRLKLRLITAFLNIIQPLARLYGRLRYGLIPWRWRGTSHFAFPKTQTWTIWSEKWQTSESRLQALESALKHVGAIVCRGGDYDDWDLEVMAGLFGRVRVGTVIEEHGNGKQLMRFWLNPRGSMAGFSLFLLFSGLAIGAALDRAWAATAIIAAIALLIFFRIFLECGGAMGDILAVVRQSGGKKA
jgi:hypothetical protein